MRTARRVALIGSGPSSSVTWPQAADQYDEIVCINSGACFPEAPEPFDYWVGVDTPFFRLHQVPFPPKAIVTWRSSFVSLSRMEQFAHWFPSGWQGPDRLTDLVDAKGMETYKPKWPDKVFRCSMEIAIAFICGQLANPEGCLVDCFGLDWGGNTNILGVVHDNHTTNFFREQERRGTRHRLYWVGKGVDVRFERVLPTGRVPAFEAPKPVGRYGLFRS